MATSLLCRLGMHRWQTQVNEQGQRYRTCERCRKDDDPGSRVPLPGGGGGAACACSPGSAAADATGPSGPVRGTSAAGEVSGR